MRRAEVGKAIADFDSVEVGKALPTLTQLNAADSMPTSTEVGNDFRRDAMNSDTKKSLFIVFLATVLGSKFFYFLVPNEAVCIAGG